MNAATSAVDPTQLAMIKAMMSEYDIHIGLDISGSMASPHKAGQTRWAAAKELILTVHTAASQIDDDGLNLVTFNSQSKVYKNIDAAGIESIFSAGPGGGTALAPALTSLFSVAGGDKKKDLIVVITDGEPSDPNEAIKALVAQANSQTNDDDCTILIMQVGNDKDATAYLKMLDDDLVKKHGAKFDIVDVKTAEEVYAAPSFAHLLQQAIAG